MWRNHNILSLEWPLSNLKLSLLSFKTHALSFQFSLPSCHLRSQLDMVFSTSVQKLPWRGLWTELENAISCLSSVWTHHLQQKFALCKATILYHPAHCKICARFCHRVRMKQICVINSPSAFFGPSDEEKLECAQHQSQIEMI